MAKSTAFSITSPDIAKRARGMASANVGLIVRNSALTVGEKLAAPMRTAAAAAGASAGLVHDITVHDGHLNELVMRDQGHHGDVIVGVGGDSRHADEAEELEWGGPDTNPAAFVRTTVSRHARDTVTMWSNEMTRELDRQVLR